MYESVASCYEGQSILLTGCTGFLGKVLLEKLLYSCPGIEKIYVLVRDKKNVTAQQRITKILEQPIFARLKTEYPDALDKIVPVAGDISEPRMGIKTEDEEILINKVSIVFHVAATVKFLEPFEVAMNINVAGTRRILNLSQRMKNIKAFVYVSTAYSNSDREVIEEITYPPPASLKEVSKLLEVGITEEQIKQLIGKRPNAYTFTKALAENLIADSHGDIPTVIVRPSVVSSSYREPLVGWVDNWFGASGLVATVAKGLNRVVLARATNVLDLIPVDYVTNLMIVAASTCHRGSSEEVQVYNSSTSGDNPLDLNRLRNLIIEDSLKNKYYDVIRPSVYYTRSKWLLILFTLIFQLIPAFIADLFLLITGKKTRYMKLVNRVCLIRDTLEFFTSNTWTIQSTKTRSLYASLSPADQRIFPCDPVDISWKEYIPTYLKGINTFLQK